MSLQRRMRQAQPLQVRAVAFLSRASILSPYCEEAPNVAIPTPLRTLRLGVLRRLRAIGRAVLRRRRVRRPGPIEEVVT